MSQRALLTILLLVSAILVAPVSADPAPTPSLDAARNEYFAVWSNEDNADAFGQLLDPALTALGSPVRLTSRATYLEKPVVAYDHHHNEYICLWSEFQLTTDWDGYGTRVSPAGQPIGHPFGFTTGPDVQLQLALAQDTQAGPFLFVWHDFRNQSWDIYGQLWVHPRPTYLPIMRK